MSVPSFEALEATLPTIAARRRVVLVANRYRILVLAVATSGSARRQWSALRDRALEARCDIDPLVEGIPGCRHMRPGAVDVWPEVSKSGDLRGAYAGIELPARQALEQDLERVGIQSWILTVRPISSGRAQATVVTPSRIETTTHPPLG